MDVAAAATRKIGPLPAWGWGVAIGGGFLAIRMLRGGGSGGNGAQPETILVPTGGPSVPHDYIGQLGQAVSEIRDRLAGIETGLKVPTPTTGDKTPPKAPPPPTAPGSPVSGPTPSNPTPKPVSATPRPRITETVAYQVMRSIGAPGSWLQTSFAKSNDYIWESEEALRAWALRYAATPTSGYKVVDGKVVKE